MRKTRFKVAVAATAVALGTLAGCGSDSAAESADLTQISVQTYPGIWTNVLVWVSQDQGFYKKHGLDVKAVEIGTGPQGLAALQGGSIQLSQNTSDNLIVSAAKGIKVKAVVGNFGDMYTLMVGKKIQASGTYPDNVKALKGAKIGITAPGASTDMIAKSTIVDAGMKEGDAKYVAVGGTAGQVTGMSSGTVDAVVAMTPQDAVFEANGGAKPLVRYAAGEGPEVIKQLNGCFQTYFGLSDWIDKNKDTAAAFAAAHKDAAAWANDPANTEALAKLLQSKAPIAGVDNATDVALKATKQMVEAGQITTAATAECLDSWGQFLNDFGVIDTPIKGADVLWDGK